MSILTQRLQNQSIIDSQFTSPREVVSHLCAVQAQDYLGSLWAIGLRLNGGTESLVEAAIDNRTIVRSWPMRGTLHFVAADDLRWMLKLLTPRPLKRAGYNFRLAELDNRVFNKCRKVVEKEFAARKSLTREELYDVLNRAKISTENPRGLHIINYLALHGVICMGSRRGKQPTLVLLDDWLPSGRELRLDEALAELAVRYFTSHGPATMKDFAWWSGLSPADARHAVEVAGAELQTTTIGKRVLLFTEMKKPKQSKGLVLLPAYDEYTVGYEDRSDFLDPKHAALTRNGIFNPVLLQEGKIAGIWQRHITKSRITIDARGFKSAKPSGLAGVAKSYAQFLNSTVVHLLYSKAIETNKPQL